jgi:hypothetical protein
MPSFNWILCLKIVGRTIQGSFNMRLRGGAPKGGKGAKGAAKDAGAKAAGGGKDAAGESSQADAPFPEARLEDIPPEVGVRHEFWMWCQNLNKEYDDGTRQISPELLQKKANSGKSLTVRGGKICTRAP